MIYKLKLLGYSFINSKTTLWIIDIILFICVCYAFVALRRKGSFGFLFINDLMVLENGYRVRGPRVSREQLGWRLEQLNANLRVLNKEMFSDGDPRCIVLAVQAGRGAAQLQRLLSSLARVRGIGNALLVVSHSFYDENLNRLVRSVRFCPVLQIFYPYSLQLFPDRFPGPDPADCPPGDANPDSFCMPRNAALTEHKQHWWWTAHFVFGNYLPFSDEHTGIVLFLQEDEYVAPDLLHMLQFAEKALSYHTEAHVISLGRRYVSDLEYNLLMIDPWRPPFDHGLGFNRSTWQKIQELAARFCTYDDASWSYSLLNLFAGLKRGHADMIATKAPRVLAAPDAATEARARRRLEAAALFPARVRSVFQAAPGGRIQARFRMPPHGNGGWSDLRDQLLCLDPMLVTTTSGTPQITYNEGHQTVF